MSKSLVSEVYSRLADISNSLDDLRDDVKDMLPPEMPEHSKQFVLEKLKEADKHMSEALTSLQCDEEEQHMTKEDWAEVKGDLEYHERKEMGLL